MLQSAKIRERARALNMFYVYNLTKIKGELIHRRVGGKSNKIFCFCFSISSNRSRYMYNLWMVKGRQDECHTAGPNATLT